MRAPEADPPSTMSHPLMAPSNPPTATQRLLARWRKTNSTSNLRETNTRGVSAEGQRGVSAAEGQHGWHATSEKILRDVPAIFQERLESITVLECRSNAPTQLKLRCCSRQELLELVIAEETTTTLSSTAPPLRLRDMRRLDPSIAQHSPPALMLRKGALLLSITRLGLESRGCINAIVKHDRCFFLARGPDDQSVIAVHQQLVRLLASGSATSPGGGSAGNASGDNTTGKQPANNNLGSSDNHPIAGEALPFEFLALEAILLHSCDALVETSSALARLVESDVAQLGVQTPSNSPTPGFLKASSATVLRHRLRELTVRVQEELALASALANAISKPIEDDVLSDVCLSRARQVSLEGGGGSGSSNSNEGGAAGGRSRSNSNNILAAATLGIVGGGGNNGNDNASSSSVSEEDAAAMLDVEVLLEAYLHETLHVTSTLRALSRWLDRGSAELAFQLDAARNRLLHFEVVATSIGTAMSVGAVISGILGMNLKTDIFHQEDWLFDATAVGIAVLCILTVIILVWLLRSSGAPRTELKGRKTGAMHTHGGQELVTLDRPLSERPPTWQRVAEGVGAPIVREVTRGSANHHGVRGPSMQWD